MDSDIGELLREGIDRQAAGTSLRPGLAAQAFHRHRRRLIAIRAATAGGTAIVAVAAVLTATIGANGAPPRRAGEPPIQTTAYVVGRAEQALAAVERGDAMQEVRGRIPHPRARSGGFAAALVWSWPHMRNVDVRNPHGPNLSVQFQRFTSWYYRGRTRIAGYGADGSLVFQAGPTTTTLRSGRQPAPRVVVIDYRTRLLLQPLSLGGPGTPRLSCRMGPDSLPGTPGAIMKSSPDGWAAVVHKALSCGLFQVAGRQRIDGVPVIRLAATSRMSPHLAPLKEQVTLWIDARSFLPVRLEWAHRQVPFYVADFSWLHPTSDNLRALRVSVPAGIRQARLPAGRVLAIF
jgi:hypothetical protein